MKTISLPGTTYFTRTTSDVAAWLDGIAAEIKLLQTTHESPLCGLLIEEARKALISAAAANRFEAQQEADDLANTRSGAIFAQEDAAEQSRAAMLFSYFPGEVLERATAVMLVRHQETAARLYAKARRLLGYES